MSGRMTNDELRRRLAQRRADLRERARRIDVDLRREPDADAPDRAIQQANDEVLVALRDAALSEVAHIDSALTRLDASGPRCLTCGRAIEAARLAAVPDALTCERCLAGEPAIPGDGELAEAFDACDTDHDGSITCEEFQQLLRRCGSTLSDEKQREEFDRIDRDGERRIGWKEFGSWWEAR